MLPTAVSASSTQQLHAVGHNNGINTSKPSVSSKNKDKIDYEKQAPPITAYDKRIPTELSHESPQKGLLYSLAQTFIALIIVLGLILLCSKYGLSRLTALRNGGAGKYIEVVERIQLDPKHSLFVVDVKENGRLLLGSGDGKVNLLSQLAPHQPKKSSTFSQALESISKTPIKPIPSSKIDKSS